MIILNFQKIIVLIMIVHIIMVIFRFIMTGAIF